MLPRPSPARAVLTSNLIVARFLDGRTVKGTTRDFAPGKVAFHVDPSAEARPIEVPLKQLKAVYFVRSHAGDPTRQDLKGFVAGPAETRQGRKIAVRFHDGELLCGYTLAYSPGRDGFYVFPADATTNHLRVFVVSSAAAEVQTGPAADRLAQAA